MSLARTALRLLSVAILTGDNVVRPTIADARVYDSRVDDLAPETFTEDARPALIVITDDDDGDALSDSDGGPPFRRNIDLVIELGMVERHKADSGYVIGYPDTDSRLEASLDFLEHQVLDVFKNGMSDAALVFQSKVRIWKRECHRQVTDDSGVKMACRLLKLKCEISDDQSPVAGGLPEPLLSVAAVLPPGPGATTVAAIAAALVAQAQGVPFHGIDWRYDGGTEDEIEHVVVGKTDFPEP